jgi:phosphate transport system substrate-binding protein
LSGAGATFPSPLYEEWFATFQKKFSDIPVAYRAIGSGAGAEALAKQEVDFAASDVPLTDAQLAAYPLKIHHIPTVVGGVVLIYRIDGFARDLRLTRETLAGIYLGKIKRWNDPELKAANRGVELPDRAIAVIHRSDVSGTTYIWTSFLSAVSPEWRSVAGSGASVSWPAGAGAEYNEGVAKKVASTPDSIGYVEFFYALENRLSYALVRNTAGQFVQADLTTLPAAVESLAPGAGDDLRLSIVNAPGKNSYPIAALTWLLVPAHFENPERGRAMTKFLRWMLDTGQKQAGALGYAALPRGISDRAGRLVDQIDRDLEGR